MSKPYLFVLMPSSGPVLTGIYFDVSF